MDTQPPLSLRWTKPFVYGSGGQNHQASKILTFHSNAIREPLFKRPLDIVLSILMMVLSGPFFLPIAMAIKLEDGGPIFYRQERWGWRGKRFRVYKFRTMVPHSDRQFGIKQAIEGDRRITSVGRVLRSMGLDELPQLINILWGEMSFVGPRSLAVGEIVEDEQGRVTQYENTPGFRERLQVRPGLTGLATIYIPKDAPPRHKFCYDRLYIRQQSFWLDVRLIAISFWISVRGRWGDQREKNENDLPRA